MTEYQGRGMLTKRITDISFEKWGRVLTQTELRLFPYLVHCALNRECIVPAQISNVEREFISSYREQGLLEGGASSPVRLTKEFWSFVSEVLWLGYVDLTE